METFSSEWTIEERTRFVVLLTMIIGKDIASERYGAPGRPNVTTIHHAVTASRDELEKYRKDIEGIVELAERERVLDIKLAPTTDAMSTMMSGLRLAYANRCPFASRFSALLIVGLVLTLAAPIVAAVVFHDARIGLVLFVAMTSVVIVLHKSYYALINALRNSGAIVFRSRLKPADPPTGKP